MRAVPWSLYDSAGRCLEVGTVPAASDSAALQAVLNRPRRDLRADRWYRVKAGAAVASAAGDEFARVGSASSLPGDAAGDTAKAELEAVQRAREGAERGIREFLKGRTAAQRAAKALEETPSGKREREIFVKHFAGELERELARGSPVADVLGGDPDGYYSGGYPYGRHPAHGHVLDRDSLIWREHGTGLAEVTGRCGNCGFQLTVPYYPDPVDPIGQGHDLVLRLRSAMATRQCPARAPVIVTYGGSGGDGSMSTNGIRPGAH